MASAATPSSVVVVVEDDASMRQAIERILRTAGSTPVLFGSAEALLATDTADRAACLVLDVSLPGMSGIELYRQLGTEGCRRPAVFITAHDDQSQRREAFAAGAREYLTKPFLGRTLLQAIRLAVDTDCDTEHPTEP